MKKIFLALLMVFMAVHAFAAQGKMNIRTIFIEKTLSASASDYAEIDMDTLKPTGFASLQVELSGDGTAKVYIHVSNDGMTFGSPDSGATIKQGLTEDDYFIQFDLPFFRYVRIFVEETGGVNSITIKKASLNIQ